MKPKVTGLLTQRQWNQFRMRFEVIVWCRLTMQYHTIGIERVEMVLYA
jgi:hypothetical protein